MKLNNNVYDVLKYLVMVGLPAFTTFFATCIQALGYDNLQPVITILVAFTTFLGTLVGISSYGYNKESEDIEKIS